MHADPRHDSIKERVELTGRGREKLEYKHVGPSGLSRAAERMCRDKREYLLINTVATGCSRLQNRINPQIYHSFNISEEPRVRPARTVRHRRPSVSETLVRKAVIRLPFPPH